MISSGNLVPVFVGESYRPGGREGLLVKMKHGVEQIVNRLRKADVAAGKEFRIPEVFKRLGSMWVRLKGIQTEKPGSFF